MKRPGAEWRRDLYAGVRAHREEFAAYEVSPPAGVVPPRTTRLFPRQCFARASRFLLDQPSDLVATLVQGLIGSEKILHAWVLLPGGVVYDGVFNRFYQRSDYYRERRAIDLVVYSPLEVARLILEEGTLGPWRRTIEAEAEQEGGASAT